MTVGNGRLFMQKSFGQYRKTRKSYYFCYMKQEEFEKMNMNDRDAWLDNMSTDEMNKRYGYVNWQMGNTIKSYDEYKAERKCPKYFGERCFVAGCTNEAEYEVGDVRSLVGMCEQCAHIKRDYLYSLIYRPKDLIKTRENEGTW